MFHGSFQILRFVNCGGFMVDCKAPHLFDLSFSIKPNFHFSQDPPWVLFSLIATTPRATLNTSAIPNYCAAKIGAKSAKVFLTNTTEHLFTSTGVGPPKTSSKTCTRFLAGIRRKT